MSRNKQILMICIFLTVATLTVFWSVNQCDFINYDDSNYVTKNNHVQNGITMEGIRWAFTTGYNTNWHPLTWISHLLDVQLFGLQPRWHHFTNLLFHLANTLLLFFVLYRMTKAHWESAFVAALFALHPLHVESVAWVAERKDVLSAFFWMLTLGAYCRYVERPGLRRYLIVVLFFALGLMAKPMLVTLPFVLLLLDYWPLQRFPQKRSDQIIRTRASNTMIPDKRQGKSKKRTAVKDAVNGEGPAGSRYQWALIRPLLWEKIPLFALTALSSLVTYIVQQSGGAVKALPASVYIANAFVSYIAYIGQTIWPNDLAVFYPYPGSLPAWQVVGAAFLLIAITAIVIGKARRYPYFAVGWLWYLGALVPVIGIVQVGLQSRADRYTYIPLIGLFIMAAWGISELSKNWRHRKEVLFATSTALLLCLCIVTWTQVRYWRNSLSLFEHALNVTADNYVAYNHRGTAYFDLGNYQQAISDYDKSIQIHPKHPGTYYGRGNAYAALGNYRQAIADYEKAIEIMPQYSEARNKLGMANAALGNVKQMAEDSDKASEVNPKSGEAYYNRGNTNANLGNYRQAIVDYDKAIEINPNDEKAYNNRGSAYSKLGNNQQAIADYNKVIQINPKYEQAYYNRGVVYASLGNYQLAIVDYDKAIQLNPKDPETYYKRGYVNSHLGKNQQAIEDLKAAARLGHKNAQAFLQNRRVTW